MSRRYSIFDQAALGTDLDLDNGGVVLTTVTSGLSIARMCRGTVSKTGGSATVEFIVYGDTGGSLTNKVSIGIATSASSLNNYVGAEVNSIGYRLGEGAIYRSGAQVDTTPAACVMGDVITLDLTYGVEVITVVWKRNGAIQASYTLDGGSPLDSIFDSPLYWAVSIGSNIDAGDIKVFVNSGRQIAEWPSVVAAGWYSVASIGQTVRVSDVPYISRPQDSPQSTRWHGLLSAASMQISRGVTFWCWSDRGAAKGSVLSVTLSDPDGLCDSMLSGEFRDQPVQLQTVEPGEPLSSATSLGSFVIERVEVIDELTRRITARDQLASLEIPMQRRFFRPDAAEDAAFRAWPIMCGAVFSAEPVLIDESDFRYALDSLGVSNIGKVRDAGDPLEVGSSPTTYTLENGGQTLRLATVPFGILTVDAEFTGSSYEFTDGSPPPDVVNNEGYPFTGVVGNPPTNWDTYGYGGSSPSDVYYNGSGRVRFEQDYSQVYFLEHETDQFQVGKSYRVEFTVYSMQRVLGLGSVAVLDFSYFRGVLNQVFRVQSTSIADVVYSVATGSVTLPHTFSFVYTPTVNHVPIFCYQGNNVVKDGFQTDCEIGNFRGTEIPVIDTDAEDDTVEDALAPLPLNLLLQNFIEVRGEKSASIWSQASALAIDTFTGYAGQGYFTRDQVTVRDAINQVMDGYTASVFLDRNGVLQVTRLVAPENETAVTTLDKNDLLTPPLPTWDEAPGLSRQMGARRNERVLTDTDLVTDEVEVTLRLRRKLARQHRYIVASGAPLAPGYAHADAAAPVDSRLVRRVDAQAEINRICALYTVPRAFWSCTAAGRDDIEVGTVITLTYPRFGLDAGVNLYVVNIEEDRLNNTQQLTLWGLAP